MKTTTIFEYEAVEYEWSQQDLLELERLRSMVGADVLRAGIKGRKRVLRAAQFVGVVRLGLHTFQILPKIYRQGTDSKERAREATRNLLYMLDVAGMLDVQENALVPLLQENLDWFEILTRIFTSHLLEEWQRGAYRAYQVVEDELPLIRGKWRLAEQLRHPQRRTNFYVAYDEFSADNKINRAFRYVVERLSRLSWDAQNRQLLYTVREFMEEVTLLPLVTVADANPSLITRLNQQYEPLLNLARLFLEDGALQLSVGDLTSFAFVFDMNALFERFIASVLRNDPRLVPDYLQDCEMLVQGEGYSLSLASRAGRGHVFRLEPDLIFRCGELSVPLILDTKYKYLRAEQRNLGVAQDDFYQMYAYATRYGCQKVILLYPQTADTEAPLRVPFLLEGSGKVIWVATLDLRVDLARDTDKWLGELGSLLKLEG